LVLPADADRAVWLQARRWRDGVGYCIGASDAPNILDLPGVGTPREVYQEKVGRVERPETENMRWGKLHEETIAREWQHRRQTVVRNVGLVSNVDHPWLQCTLDRRVVMCPDNTELKSRCALEVKTRGAFNNARWHAEVPDDILAQCMVQMMVTGYRHIHTAVLVGGSELHDPVVWWDADLADYIFREVDLFRRGHLEAEVEPPWSETKPLKEIALDKLMHPDRVGEIGIVDIGEVIDYARLAAEAGAAKRAQDRAKARLLEIAAGKQALLFADQPAVWWREGSDTQVDLDVLARFPEAYAAAVTTKTTWTICIAKEYRAIEARTS
jgi:putative phage-type endonuclease